MSLRRRVALKVLPFAAPLAPRHLQRFKNEAQAAASLEHPNIVNVYSVGCERGVHYYAMQYVEGQTLAEVIAGLRQGSGAGGQGPGEGGRGTGEGGSGTGERGREKREGGEKGVGLESGPPPSAVPLPPSPSPHHPITPSPPQAPADTDPLGLLSTEGSTRSPEFFRTVARLGIQAAEALEHAHQMGVVHRDIKPSNLMVESRLPSPSGRRAESLLPSPSGRGAGGEGRGTQAPRLWITDFGLARISTPSPLRGEGRGEGAWGDGASLTMTGDILGTLRYMSPEQLQAKHGVLDHRTDIYSLGLTLYELLTLQAAFPGEDRGRLMRRIAEDDPRPPRQLNKAIPTDLETIVMKATAKEPESRYGTAQQLADDLRRFVEDSPIQARRPTLAQRAARWSRRHYWLVSRGIAASFALLSITTLLIFNAHRRELKQRQRAEMTLATALNVLDSVYLEYAGEGYLKATLASDQPEPAEQITPKTWNFLVDALAFYAQFAAFNPDEPSLRWRLLKAKIRMGECQSRLGYYRDAEQTFKSAISLAEKLMSEVQGPSMYQEDLARAQAGLADVAARQHNWDQAVVDLTHAIRFHSKNADAYDNREYAVAYNNRGYAYLKKGEFGKAVADLKQAIRLEPDVAIPHGNLGYALHRQERFEEAAAEYREVIRLKPDHAVAHGNLGVALHDQGKLDEAVAEFREAIRLGPDSPTAHSVLAQTLRAKGNYDEAIAEFREAIRLQPDNARYHCGLGWALDDEGKRDEAIAEFREAIRLEPDDSRYHCSLGAVLRTQKKWDESLAEIREAIRLQPDQIWYHDELARTLHAQGKVDEAIAEWREAIRLQPDYAPLRINLAYALLRQGKSEEPNELLAKAKQPDETLSHYFLVRDAGALLLAGRTKEYRHLCLEAMKRFGSASDGRARLWAARCSALAPDALPDAAQAVKAAESGLAKCEQAGQKVSAWKIHTVGLTQLRVRQLDLAARRFRESMEAEPTWHAHFLNWLGLAVVHCRRGEMDEARGWLAKATEYAKKYPDKYTLSGEDWAEGELLRREVEKLLAAPQPQKDAAEPKQENPADESGS
jgi:tetratricopeptide (TPR) repeat protein